MKKAGKTYHLVMCDGAGYGFLRAGEAPDAGKANKMACDEARKRRNELLGKV